MSAHTPSGLIVAWSEAELAADARETAHRLHLFALPLADVNPSDVAGPSLALVRTASRWELHDLSDGRVRPTAVTFAGTCVDDTSASARGRHLLARAVGLDNATVIDATAGFGQDAFALAALGYRVTAIERCGAMAVLLADGLRRARKDATLAACVSRVELIVGDARDLFAQLLVVDTIYIDPMFPPKRHATAARKEMRLLRALAGSDDDAAELVTRARVFARKRVVVKRPDDAAPLIPAPHMHYQGKLVRYDVYLPLPAVPENRA